MDRFIKASTWTIAVAGGITVGLGLTTFTKHVCQISKSALDEAIESLPAVHATLIEQHTGSLVSVKVALAEYVEALLIVFNTNSWYRLVHKDEYDSKFRNRVKELIR